MSKVGYSATTQKKDGIRAASAMRELARENGGKKIVRSVLEWGARSHSVCKWSDNLRFIL